MKKQYKKVNKNVYFTCSYTARNRERAELVIKNRIISAGTYSWINRPWQRFNFDIAMAKAFKMATLSPYYSRLIKKFLDNGGKREKARIKKEFGSVAMVTKMGDIFCQDKKESNDWKTRMIKAGIPGLSIPENWAQLSERERERRLNNVINNLETI